MWFPSSGEILHYPASDVPIVMASDAFEPSNQGAGTDTGSSPQYTYEVASDVAPTDGFMANHDSYGSSSVRNDPDWRRLTPQAMDVRLGTLIQESGHASVWRSNCGQFSIKTLRGHPSMADVLAFATLMTRTSRLNHPRIAAPLAVTSENASSDLRVVTAFAERGDLRSLLWTIKRYKSKNDPAMEDSTWTWQDGKGQIAVDVTEALVYLHAEQPAKTAFVERDPHTSHVLVDGDGRAVLSIAHFSRTQPANASRSGSRTVNNQAKRCPSSPLYPYWLAPEVLRGGVVTVASDVFAFDVLLCELDTDCMPFGDGGVSWSELEGGAESTCIVVVMPGPHPAVGDAVHGIHSLTAPTRCADHVTVTRYVASSRIKNDLGS